MIPGMLEAESSSRTPVEEFLLRGDGGGALDQGRFQRELLQQLAAVHRKLDAVTERLDSKAAQARSPGPRSRADHRSPSRLKTSGSAASGSSSCLPLVAELRQESTHLSTEKKPVVESIGKPSQEAAPVAAEASKATTAAGTEHAKEQKSRHFNVVQSMFGGSLAERQLTLWTTEKNTVWEELRGFFRSLAASSSPDASRRIVHCWYFHLLCSLVIVMNAVVFGFTADSMLHSKSDEPEPWQSGLTWFFTCFFLLELLMRLQAERLRFFTGDEWRWNLFDTLLVIESFVSVALANRGWNTSMVRVVRMAKFVRLARITRVARHLTALRMVLFSILESMSQLFWCFVVIALVIYVFAVVFVTGAAEAVKSPDSSPELIESLMYWWGGVTRSMVSLFMVLSGGADWNDIVSPLKELDSVYEALFIAYVFIMQFGVLNIVIGTFVAAAAEVAEKDRDFIVQCELQQVENIIRRIRTFFHEADTDKSGTLSWGEFEKHMQNAKVRAYFQTLELDVSQAHILFKLLDTDDGGEVTIDEFIDGAMRLRGAARNIGLHMLAFMTDRMNQNLGVFMNDVHDRFDAVEKFMDVS